LPLNDGIDADIFRLMFTNTVVDSGETNTLANEVWRRLAWSKGKSNEPVDISLER
jgi:hypothetical protein